MCLDSINNQMTKQNLELLITNNDIKKILKKELKKSGAKLFKKLKKDYVDKKLIAGKSTVRVAEFLFEKCLQFGGATIISRDYIANSLDISISTVRDALNELKDIQFIFSFNTYRKTKYVPARKDYIAAESYMQALLDFSLTKEKSRCVQSTNIYLINPNFLNVDPRPSIRKLKAMAAKQKKTATKIHFSSVENICINSVNNMECFFQQGGKKTPTTCNTITSITKLSNGKYDKQDKQVNAVEHLKSRIKSIILKLTERNNIHKKLGLKLYSRIAGLIDLNKFKVKRLRNYILACFEKMKNSTKHIKYFNLEKKNTDKKTTIAKKHIDLDKRKNLLIINNKLPLISTETNDDIKNIENKAKLSIDILLKTAQNVSKRDNSVLIKGLDMNIPVYNLYNIRARFVEYCQNNKIYNFIGQARAFLDYNISKQVINLYIKGKEFLCDGFLPDQIIFDFEDLRNIGNMSIDEFFEYRFEALGTSFLDIPTMLDYEYGLYRYFIHKDLKVFDEIGISIEDMFNGIRKYIYEGISVSC